jgi:hypothetical protein
MTKSIYALKGTFIGAGVRLSDEQFTALNADARIVHPQYIDGMALRNVQVYATRGGDKPLFERMKFISPDEEQGLAIALNPWKVARPDGLEVYVPAAQIDTFYQHMSAMIEYGVLKNENRLTQITIEDVSQEEYYHGCSLYFISKP